MSARLEPFLQQLAAGSAEALLARARRRRVGRGERVIHAGSLGDDVVIVLSGRVQLVAPGAEERDVILAIRGPGELIGEMAAFGGLRRTASAVAIDEVEVGLLSAAAFREYLMDQPDAALVLIRMLVGRLAEADRDRIDLATLDSVGRVAKRLLELAAEHGRAAADGRGLEISLTQDELAGWTGTTRETVSRALRMMRELGWLATAHRTITLLQPGELRKRAGEPVT